MYQIMILLPTIIATETSTGVDNSFRFIGSQRGEEEYPPRHLYLRGR